MGVVASVPAEVWPPTVTPDMYFDFDLGEGYWGGSAKTLSDFIDDGGGTYRILWGDLGLSGTENYTMMVEVYNDALAFDATSVTDVFSFKESSTVATNFRIPQPAETTFGGFTITPTFVYKNPTQTNAISVFETPGGNNLTNVAYGRIRSLAARENGGDTRTISSHGARTDVGITNTGTSYPAGTKYLYINQAPSTFGDAVGTPNTSGLPIKRVALWADVLTDAQLWATSRFGRAGLTILGDSFLTGGRMRRAITEHIEDQGRPLSFGFHIDAVGGVGLDAHATRFASLTDNHDDYLIIMEGGWDNDYATSVSALASIVGNLTHDNWVVVEPNPINAIGTPQRDGWNDLHYGASDNPGTRAFYNHVVSTYGAAHYLKTYDLMLANGDGSAGDLADIAAGQWPGNVTDDGTHPNTVGHELLGGLIGDYAIAQKWV